MCNGRDGYQRNLRLSSWLPLHSTSVLSFYIDVVLTLSIMNQLILFYYEKSNLYIKGLIEAFCTNAVIYLSISESTLFPLQWRHNERDGVSNPQPHDCLLNRLFRHRWKKTSKLRVTGLCEGKSPVTGEFPAQTASNAENVFSWWRHRAR